MGTESTPLFHLAGAIGAKTLELQIASDYHHACYSPNSPIRDFDYATCVTSKPKSDWDAARAEGFDDSQILAQLDFVLLNASIHYFPEGEDQFPNAPKFLRLVSDENEESPKALALGYSVTLRILERICNDGSAFIGIPPQSCRSELWKWEKLPETFDPSKGPKLTYVEPDQIHIRLGRETFAYFEGPGYQLRIFDSIGLEIPSAKWSKQIDPQKPFVAVSTQIASLELDLYEHEIPLLVANEAFLELIDKDPEAAKQLSLAAIQDLFFYRKQSESQAEYSFERFEEEFLEPITLLKLRDRDLYLKKKEQEFRAKLNKLVYEYAGEMSLNLFAARHYEPHRLNTFKLLLDDEKLSFQATAETSISYYHITKPENGPSRIREDRREFYNL